MKAYSTMVHRTATERKTSASDEGGGYTESWTAVTSDIHCRAWALTSTQMVMSDHPEIVNVRMVLVPLDTDVAVGDRLVSVTDRKGTVLFAGPFIVDGVSERPDHLQLTTRKVT